MNKNASSKVLLSLGVATLLYSSALGAAAGATQTGGSQSIELTDKSKITENFQQEGKNIVLKSPDKYKGQDLSIKFSGSSGVNLPGDMGLSGNDYRLSIDMGSNALTFQNDGSNAAYVTNLNATAKTVTAKDIILQAFVPSVINGELKIENSGDALTQTDKKGSAILLMNGGSLTVNGAFTADKTLFETYGGSVNVNGKATITNSNFKLIRNSYSDLEANNVVLVQAKEFNNDILNKDKKNQAGALLYKSLNDYIITNLQGKGTTIDASAAANAGSGGNGYGPLVNYTLNVKNCGGNQCLVINGGATAEAKDELTQLKVDQAVIDELIKGVNGSGDDEKVAKEALTKQKTEIKSLIDAATKNGNKIDDSKYLDIVAPNLNANDKASVLALRSITKKLGSIGADLASREGVKLALNIKKDTDNTGKSISNLNSASSAVNNTMNVSNDVSIGSRVAMLNNPFGTYASKISGLKFAALESDVKANYVSDYTQSVWANAFGGANIIDGDSGAMYGATVGVDKQANDNVLWGVYLTLADAKIKDNSLEQRSNNVQVGMYSTINVAPQWELNLKAYTQISPTKQDNFETATGVLYHSDYMSKFFGFGANVGHVFDFSNNTFFVKPFAGMNYYLSLTPSYTENGPVAKNIASMTNNSVSVEVGAEFRKYMSENSYIFATPKIEQFVINNGSDYTANLAVNNAFFTSVKANDKKKTYGQVVVGGNVDLTNRLSMNLGFGAKQILAGKVDSKNETYLSGQLGVKYKF